MTYSDKDGDLKDDATDLGRAEYEAKYPGTSGIAGGYTDGRTVVLSPGSTQRATVGRPGSPVVVNRELPPNIGNVSDAKNLDRKSVV